MGCLRVSVPNDNTSDETTPAFVRQLSGLLFDRAILSFELSVEKKNTIGWLRTDFSSSSIRQQTEQRLVL